MAPWDLARSQAQRGLFVPKGCPFVASRSGAPAWVRAGEGHSTPAQVAIG